MMPQMSFNIASYDNVNAPTSFIEVRFTYIVHVVESSEKAKWN